MRKVLCAAQSKWTPNRCFDRDGIECCHKTYRRPCTIDNLFGLEWLECARARWLRRGGHISFNARLAHCRIGVSFYFIQNIITWAQQQSVGIYCFRLNEAEKWNQTFRRHKHRTELDKGNLFMLAHNDIVFEVDVKNHRKKFNVKLEMFTLKTRWGTRSVGGNAESHWYYCCCHQEMQSSNSSSSGSTP